MSWTKYYIDGSKYVATNEDIELKKASWRNSRNEGMIGVDLENSGVRLSLKGIGEYWQSETMIAVFPVGEPIAISHRVQKKIDPNDSTMAVHMGTSYTIEVHKKFPLDVSSSMIPIPAGLIGKWLTLEHNFEDNTIHYYFSDTKL